MNKNLECQHIFAIMIENISNYGKNLQGFG